MYILAITLALTLKIMTVGERWFQTSRRREEPSRSRLHRCQYVVSEQQRSSVDWSITACGGSYEVGFGSTTSLTDVFPDALYQATSSTGIREQS